MSQYMFLAKVRVGTYTKGHFSYVRLPSKQPTNPESDDVFDSCVDDTIKPTIFVVFDNNRFYPEYVISFP